MTRLIRIGFHEILRVCDTHFGPFTLPMEMRPVACPGTPESTAVVSADPRRAAGSVPGQLPTRLRQGSAGAKRPNNFLSRICLYITDREMLICLTSPGPSSGSEIPNALCTMWNRELTPEQIL